MVISGQSSRLGHQWIILQTNWFLNVFTGSIVCSVMLNVYETMRLTE